MSPIETIQIDADTRILVYVDEDAEDPREWGIDIPDDDPTLIAWRNGEVYGVVLERRAEWMRADNPTVTRYEWELIDGLWSNYLTDTYTALDVAREHFNIDTKESN